MTCFSPREKVAEGRMKGRVPRCRRARAPREWRPKLRVASAFYTHNRFNPL